MQILYDRGETGEALPAAARRMNRKKLPWNFRKWRSTKKSLWQRVGQGTTVRQQRKMNDKIHFSNTDRRSNSMNAYKKKWKKPLKNLMSPLSPGTKQHVQLDTKELGKTRLYKFIWIFRRRVRICTSSTNSYSICRRFWHGYPKPIKVIWYWPIANGLADLQHINFYRDPQCRRRYYCLRTIGLAYRRCVLCWEIVFC